MRAPLWRRLLYSLVPLVIIVVGVEIAASWWAARALASRQLVLPESTMGRLSPARADEDVAADKVVVCIGDSWTFGVKLPAEQSYPAQLESLLRAERGLDVNVVNLGEPGATPLFMARRLNQFFQSHRADAVLLLMGSNTDFPESLAIEAGDPSPLLRLRPLLNRLTSYKLLVQLVARGRVTSHTILSTNDFVDKPPRFEPDAKPLPPNPARILNEEQARQNVIDNAARMDDLSAAVGAELVLLTYAIPGFLPERELGYLPRANTALREAAARRGLPILDMEGLYARHGQDKMEAILGVSMVPNNHDTHPSALGYSLYAREIADWLGPRLD